MSRSKTAIVGTVSSLLVTGRSVFGYRGGTEEPAYTVVSHVGSVEIRHYQARLAADTIVTGESIEQARKTGFKRLANYIFGENHANREVAMTAPVAQSVQKIAMTAPVSQQPTEGGTQIRFFLPSNLTLDTAPEPNDPEVKLVEVPAEDYAVLRFSGSRDEFAVTTHMAQLKTSLDGSSDWHALGKPSAWFYDPPWTLLFLRRNEVAVTVVRNDRG